MLPGSITLRPWMERDFVEIQRLSSAEGWPTPQSRPVAALDAWRQSSPAIVAVEGTRVIGFVRALTDGAVTMYIAEILVEPPWRGKGIGRALIQACHDLYPSTRLDLLSTAAADKFYQAMDFRPFQGYRKSYP